MNGSMQPFVLAALTIAVGVVAWLCRQAIAQGKEIVQIQAALKYYFETTSKGAAMVLDSPNPTPEDVRCLLRKHVSGGKLTEAEHGILVEYVQQIMCDDTVKKSEKSAVIALIAGIGSERIMHGKKASNL